MDFYDVVNYRRSIRSYKKDPVPDDALERIAKAASAAPSACNRQPVKLVAVKSPDKLARLYQACPMKFIAEAPMVLLRSAIRNRRGSAPAMTIRLSKWISASCSST